MSTATVERVFEARIAKADDEQRIAYGVILEPRGPDDPDTQGDYYDAPAVAKGCHGFNLRQALGQAWGDLLHDGITKAGYLVESYIAPVDFQLGDQLVKSGSWVGGMYVPEDEHWALVKSGVLATFSVGGTGTRITEVS